MHLTYGYTDIAFEPSGQTMYAIRANPLASITHLAVLDLETGAETSTLAVTGLPLGSEYFANALSALPDGTLLTGSAPTFGEIAQQIYQIDPATGIATLFPASFPAGYGSAGDFLTLPDGDILAVGEIHDAPHSTLFRIAPDHSVTRIGDAPLAWGAAQTGDKIYLAGKDGNLYELPEIPASESGDPIAFNVIETEIEEFWGATAAQDSGICAQLDLVKSVTPVQASYEAGDEVTYTFTVTNTGNATLQDVAIREQVFTGTGQLSNNTPATVELFEPGQIATFTSTYTLTQADVDRGMTSNTAIAYGTHSRLGEITSPLSTVTITSMHEPQLTLTKTADVAVVTEAGEIITYFFEATNTGNVTLTDVAIVENEFSGAGELGLLDPEIVSALSPGESAIFTAEYTVTEADLESETITNTAAAIGHAPDSSEVVSGESNVTIVIELPVVEHPVSEEPVTEAPIVDDETTDLARTGDDMTLAAVWIAALLIAGGAALLTARRTTATRGRSPRP